MPFLRQVESHDFELTAGMRETKLFRDFLNVLQDVLRCVFSHHAKVQLVLLNIRLEPVRHCALKFSCLKLELGWHLVCEHPHGVKTLCFVLRQVAWGRCLPRLGSSLRPQDGPEPKAMRAMRMSDFLYISDSGPCTRRSPGSCRARKRDKLSSL